MTTGHSIGQVIDIVQGPQEVTPPLYPIVAGLTQGIGDSLNSLRWVSLLAGVACIPLTYLLGVRTVGRRAALVGAGVMALSPFMIFYATEARAYALMMLLVLGSSLALLQALEGPRRRWWALYAALSCAAMYTHYTAAFVLLGQAAWALGFHRHAWKWLVGANVAAAVAYLPWLSSYQADKDSPGADLIGVLQPFGLDAFTQDVLHWAVSHPGLNFSVREMPGDVALALMALALVIAAAVTAVELLSRERALRRPGEGVILVLVLAAVTPVLAGIYSAVDVSIFLPRNLIAGSPGLALVLGWVVTLPRQRVAYVAASVLLLAGFGIGGARLLDAEGQRTDYKAAARFIAERGGPGSVTVDLPGNSPGPLSQLDAAAAPGEPSPRRPAILRLGRAPRAAQLEVGPFAAPPAPAAAAIARQAVRKAGARGEIFLVYPGRSSLADLRRETPGGLGAGFLAALGPDYRAVEARSFPGFFGLRPVTVYVLRRDPNAR